MTDPLPPDIPPQESTPETPWPQELTPGAALPPALPTMPIAPPPPVPPGPVPPPPLPSAAVTITRACVACGLPLDAWAPRCPRCGTRQPVAGSGKDRLAAAALALLFGGFGIHRFYLGQTIPGVLYLVFCWTGIPSLVAWIEGILYLTRSDEAWAAEHGGPVRRPSSAGLGCLWIVALVPLLGIIAIVAMFALIFLGGQVGGVLSTVGEGVASPPAIVETMPAPSPSPASDQAEIERLLDAVNADPTDLDALLSLGDLYYAAQDFGTASTWLAKAVELVPDNTQARLALGACRFNLGDYDEAERQWTHVIELDPRNAEAYYDLGFLALNRPTPDYATVEKMWRKVIEIAPGSELATSVQAHLDALAAESLLP